jgi:hypothetical protein
MTPTAAARRMIAITLLTVPTIAYGGLTVLAVLTSNQHGLAPAGAVELTSLQQPLFRAGHAHAGVLIILSVVLQILLDWTALAERARWLLRITALAAPILMSGGFFGIAYSGRLIGVLYAGAACLVVAVVLTGIGLLRPTR